MAVVGYLGESADDGILFTVSDQKIITPSDFKWTGSARYAVHNRHNNNALTEFTGVDPDKISFSLTLSKELGVDPMEAIVKLWRYEREGIAVALTIGSKGYGKYRWNVINHTVEVKYTDSKGDILGAEVSVELQEYLRQ